MRDVRSRLCPCDYQSILGMCVCVCVCCRLMVVEDELRGSGMPDLKTRIFTEQVCHTHTGKPSVTFMPLQQSELVCDVITSVVCVIVRRGSEPSCVV